MKRHILFLALLSMALWTLAVPALRIRCKVKLDDGRTVWVTAHGDEDLDYFLTSDGEVILSMDSTFRATGLNIEQYMEVLRVTENALQQQPRHTRRKVGSLASALVKPTGTKKIPVILTAFKDKTFSVGRTDQLVNTFYNNFFNGDDIYASTGNYGSVRKYFMEQSQGQFEPEFTVIGPVELDSVYSYYGKESGSTKDLRYSEFVKQSFTKAQSLESDWSQFDNDGDSKVDMCVIIYAGLGQNYTNAYDKNTIWPQEQPASYTINGITLAGCSSTCEMFPTAANDNGVITSWQPDGIGVAVHEISHAIGLPDLYDTKNKEFGLDFWSVMDYGMYTRSSKYPVNFTAYEREFLGWQETETIEGPRTLHISCFDQGGKGYKIISDANPNEYYILDNRQAMGWDWGVCSNRGHGMLVYHVDYNLSRWLSNKVNTIIGTTYDHQGLTIIPANNSLIGSNNYSTQAQWRASLQGNPYPGSTQNHELTDESVPASTLYSGGLMGKPIVDIQERADGIITLKVMPMGTLEAPTGLTTQDVTNRKVTAIWDEVENAELYNLRLYRDGELVLEQDSIAGNSFVLDNLQMNADYIYSVQAINDAYRNSVWAESGNFRDILDVITEMTTSTQKVRIYDLKGRFIGECFADELHRFYLRHGIYVVRRSNGKTTKVLI
ncbi:MAG: M6 family metalloprotease domain-containing protein [Bacteroidaceae bacterium]|nr:M6 family metalloprotease domain-containing protein [Bacteroidaceae bacterium]